MNNFLAFGILLNEEIQMLRIILAFGIVLNEKTQVL